MAKVSVIIPSRNERFVAPTVRDVLAKARGEIEVIVVLDGGTWPDPPLPDDPRVHVLRWTDSRGMRPAINAATRIATGEYLLKSDGHCMFAEGFDLTLQASCESDWIVIPRRFALEPETWTIKTEKTPVDAHYLSFPFERPNDPACGLHGQIWRERARARTDILLDEELSSQGSCWFMTRTHWQRLGDMDVANYGNFIQEMQELGLKTWLGGGRMMVNKATWYAHLFKGKKYGRGYWLSKHEQQRGADFAIRYWMLDQWPQRQHDLRWLIERFGPGVPSWPTDLDEAFRRARQVLREAA